MAPRTEPGLQAIWRRFLVLSAAPSIEQLVNKILPQSTPSIECRDACDDQCSPE